MVNLNTETFCSLSQETCHNFVIIRQQQYVSGTEIIK